MRVTVVGAGIAGLTAAVALAQRGFAVQVLERAASLGEIGAGIQLSPNAIAVLERLGVAALMRGTVLPEAIEIRAARRGELLTRIPLGEIARRRYGAPYCLLHRADLQSALLAAASKDDRIKIQLGCEVAGIADSLGSVAISAAGQSSSADILVGADGVHSRVRRSIFGHPDAVPLQRYALRATLPAADFPQSLAGDVTGLWLGPKAHLVHYPLQGGSKLNVVVIAGGKPSDIPPFDCFGPPIRSLLEVVPAWVRWPLHVVDARLAWTRGRVVLIGDAAHAMAPSAAQGGAQAIEDAWVLARSLAARADQPVAALQTYERGRRPRVERVVREARRNLLLYDLSGLAATARNIGIRVLPAPIHLSRLDWLFGWEPG